MTRQTEVSPSRWAPGRLLEPPTVAAVLRRALEIAGTSHALVRKVRVERCWPERRGGFVFEWSFALDRGPRRVLFGASPVRPPAAAESTRAGRTATNGLSGIRVYLPEWRLLVHSPECDPGLPHLAECLDARVMASHLRPLLETQHVSWGVTGTTTECRMLGYRAGRRASVVYRRPPSGPVSVAVLGKTFRDGRGEQLLRVHGQLAGEFGRGSFDRVRVPSALGYLPDQRMAVLSWSPGRSVSAEMWSSDEVAAAVDALTALHRTSLSGLPSFTVDHECSVVNRWYAVLERLIPSAAATTKPLRDGLLAAAQVVPAAAPRPIHRDFYDRQFVVDDQGLTLLDLDTLALGDPCVDLGNLLAHLAFAALAVRQEPVQFTRLVQQVVGPYQERAEIVDGRSLAFFCATALFRVGAVHAVRTATCRRAPAMWALAGEVLAAVKNGGLPRRRCGAAGTIGPTQRTAATRRSG